MDLIVNGERRSFEAEEDMPLLWALRDILGVKGPKFGCGVGACGACTVLIDGEPVRSCQQPVADVWGEVTTIEGIGQPGALHAVQEAWLAHGVPQCGYCQSGQILAAVALLDRNPRPTPADIDAEMTNLCRCGTYPRMREAILAAAQTMAEG